MRITLVCVGKLASSYSTVFGHYERLLRPYLTLDLREVAETPLARGRRQVLQKEGEAILKALPRGAQVIVLDRSGREFSSEELSEYLAKEKLAGTGSFAFVVGGSFGVSAAVLERADLVLSLSRLTFPHQLARCILVEQVYRAIKIERGESYHY